MSSPSSRSVPSTLYEDLPDDCDEHVEWAVREWPEIDPLVEAIVSRIGTADRIIERSAVDTLATLGLAHGDLKVLLRLNRGERSHGNIARDLLISTGTMTNRLDKLETAGLVARRPDPDDRRGVLVALTGHGRDTLDRYIAEQAARERDLLGAMSVEDKQELAHLLRKMVASLKAQVPAKR